MTSSLVKTGCDAPTCFAVSLGAAVAAIVPALSGGATVDVASFSAGTVVTGPVAGSSVDPVAFFVVRLTLAGFSLV